MTNDRLSVIRVLLCAIITLVTIVGTFWLLFRGIEVPTPVFGLAGLALAGVAGADIVSTYFVKKNGS